MLQIDVGDDYVLMAVRSKVIAACIRYKLIARPLREYVNGF